VPPGARRLQAPLCYATGVMYHLSQKFCKGLQKNVKVSVFLKKKFIQRKKAKRPNEFFKANQLETKPEKAKKSKKLLGQPTRNKARFLKFDLKKPTWQP